MKQFAVVLLLFASVPMLAQAADEAASREDIVRFVEAMKIQEQMENMQQTMYEQMDQQVEAMLDGMLQDAPRALDAQERMMLAQIVREMIEERRNDYPPAEIIRDMIPVYQKHLTKSETNAIVEFYSSPAGKALLEKSPLMTRDAIAVVMPRMQENMKTMGTQLRQRIEKMVMELRRQREQEQDSPANVN